MNSLMDALPSNVLIAVITTFGFMTSLVALMMTMRLRQTRDRYDFELSKVRMDFERESYERRLSELSRELTATKERWVDANHLVLDGQRARKPSTAMSSAPDILKSLGVDDPEISIDPRLVFVLTPFTDDEWKTFEVIREASTTSGYRCIRGDEERVTGNILAHVVTQIARSRIVVANIGSRNANVFYELGIAHAMGKQTILVSKTLVDLPFDIRQRLILAYKTEEELYNGMIQALARLGAEHRSYL